jgi:hypothetical protein
MICLSSNLQLFCQANVPTDEVQDVRPGPQGQVHPPPGHCGRGRLPLQVPQQVRGSKMSPFITRTGTSLKRNSFKGTVWPDWICMRVVPLDRP